jgi:hypothetical protein
MNDSAAPQPVAAYAALDARCFRSSTLTRGPWHPEHQHGGPPIALVCRAIEKAAGEHGLTHIARITANLLRPVPIGDLIVEVMTDYVGRNAGHFSAHLMAGDKDVARFTALAQREASIDLHDAPVMDYWPGPPLSFEQAPSRRMPFDDGSIGYARLVETRVASGTMFEGGACAVWFRMNHPLLEGEATSGYQRVAVAADSGNGISAVLDFSRYVFVNSDLTINLLRRPVGEWICVDARSFIGPDGGGLAESALFDMHGFIGRATQSLAVRMRP